VNSKVEGIPEPQRHGSLDSKKNILRSFSTLHWSIDRGLIKVLIGVSIIVQAVENAAAPLWTGAVRVTEAMPR